MENISNKRLIDLTCEEFLIALSEFLEKRDIEKQTKPPSRNLVYGISGLAKLLHCCSTTAQSIKNSGKIDGCYYLIGRKLIFDSDKVLEKLS